MIVNDNTGRRVLMFDSLLKVVAIITDSTGTSGNTYSSRLGGIMAYRGDSTLFVDPASLSMLVIDPVGAVRRTMAVPRPNEVQNLIGGPFGTPGFDAAGRLIFRSANSSALTKQRRTGRDPAAAGLSGHRAIRLHESRARHIGEDQHTESRDDDGEG